MQKGLEEILMFFEMEGYGQKLGPLLKNKEVTKFDDLFPIQYS